MAENWSGLKTFNANTTIDYNITLTGSVTIEVVGANVTVTINGVISSDNVYTLTKTGAGTLVFNAVNTYMGSTFINAGTLRLGTNSQIEISSLVSLGANAKFEISGSNKGIKALVSTNANSEVALGSWLLYIGNNGSSNSSSFAGKITGTGGIVKRGTYTQTLNGANTYTGITNIDAGKLIIGASGTIQHSSGVTFFYAGSTLEIAGNQLIKTLNSNHTNSSVILGSNTLTIGWNAISADGGGNFSGVISGAGGIVKYGTQTLTLNNSNTYTGSTTIHTGTLKLGGPGGKIETSSDVRLGAGSANVAILDISSAPKTILKLNTIYFINTPEVILGSNFLTIGASNTSVDGGGTFAGKITGTGGIIKRGTQTLTLNANNPYSGATTINAGTLEIAGENGSIEASSGVTINGSGILKISEYKTIKSLNSTSANSKVDVGDYHLLIGTSETSADGGGSFAGNITGTGGLIKSGTQVFTLDGVNTYTSFTQIHAGTLKLSTNGKIENSNRVLFSSSADATFDISSGNKTIKRLGMDSYVTVNSSAVVNLGSSTLTIGASSTSNDGDGSFEGNITGTGSITKNGTGTFELNNNNDYTGATIINAGILYINYGSSIAASSGVTINGSGILWIYGFTIIKSLNSTSANSEVNIFSDRLQIGTSVTSADGGGTFAGKISGTSALYKYGTQVFTLNGINTFSGLTNIEAGTLALGSSGSITNSSVFLVGDGKFDISSGNKIIRNIFATENTEIIIGSNTLTIGTSTGSDDGGHSLNGKVTGTGSIIKQGTYSFEIHGTHTTAISFFCNSGEVNLMNCNWMGNFQKATASTLHIFENSTVSGALTLQGGITNFYLGSPTPSTLTVTGAVLASGTNTMHIRNVGTASSYVLLQVGSGSINLANFTATGSPGTLSVNGGNQLIFTPSSTFNPVTNIIDVPATAVATEPLTLSGTVIPNNATNQFIEWSISNDGGTGASIAGNILTVPIAGTVVVTATVENGTAVGTPFSRDFTIAVSKATQNAPPAPVLAAATSSMIVLAPVSGCRYSINGGAYQTSNVFEGLAANTEYTFRQRYAETPSHLESPESEEARFSTLPLGISSTTLNNQIQVYPNPTSGELYIAAADTRLIASLQSVEVFDVSGRKVKGEGRREKGEGEVVIDISAFASGVYFLKIETEAGVVMKKIVKQ
jgi:autotransporter-associated beta strand protein